MTYILQSKKYFTPYCCLDHHFDLINICVSNCHRAHMMLFVSLVLQINPQRLMRKTASDLFGSYHATLMQTSWILTHWGRVTQICVSKLTIFGSDNGLSPGRRQAIIWTNAGVLLIVPLGTNFIENYTFLFKIMHLKMSSAEWRPFCLGLNVLTYHIEQTLTNSITSLCTKWISK